MALFIPVVGVPTDNLQITQPPLAVCSLIITEPFTGEIQYTNNHQPNQVNYPQRKPERRRFKQESLIRCNDLTAVISHGKKQEDIYKPDEVKMQHVVKERHIAIYY